MKSLLELVTEIVSSHASNTTMTTEQLVQELQTVHNALKNLESGQPADQPAVQPAEEPGKPAITVKQAFKKDEIICMVCGKGGFKTLKKHLTNAHELTPGQYRKQFGIKSSQKLAARSFSESRRKAAEERGMTAILAKAREKRMANLEAKKSPAAKPVRKVKPAAAPKKAAPKARK